MSDRLAELSDDAAHEIRTALTESREGVLIAQKRIDGLRKSPLVVNGVASTLSYTPRWARKVENVSALVAYAVGPSPSLRITRPTRDSMKDGTRKTRPPRT